MRLPSTRCIEPLFAIVDKSGLAAAIGAFSVKQAIAEVYGKITG
jgi:hypothetical protein